jgi:hypothetical protein
MQALRELPPGTVVIHGDAPGADRIGGFVAELLDFPVRKYPANWSLYGLLAGPTRNQEMLDKEHTESEPIDRAFCFHEDPKLGKGSKDMKIRLDNASPPIPVQVFIQRSR